MSYTGSKARLCKREGVNLFSSPKYQKILNKNSNVPGMHGGKRQGKQTEYAKQLREKQKAKRIFVLSEKQFKKYFDKASRSNVTTGVKLLENLERRLDNAIFRSGLAMTRFQSRQFASHGLFLLNGRRVTIPSIELKVGDVVEVRDSRKKSAVFTKNKEEQADYVAPDWLKVDAAAFKFEVVSIPTEKHFEQMIDTQPIVEFYSR